MARTERIEHQPQFLEQGGDFNDQLYKALRSSPWWMISIAFHVLLGVISSLLTSDAPPPQKNLAMTTNMSAAETPAVEDPPPTPEETEQIHQQDVVAKEPTVKDAELSDHNETDNDLPTEESLGEAGISDAPFEGPDVGTAL